MGSEEEMHTVSRMAMPVNIACAGGNGCRIAIKEGIDKYYLDVRRNRLPRQGRS
jgi:hypothetical protein